MYIIYTIFGIIVKFTASQIMCTPYTLEYRLLQMYITIYRKYVGIILNVHSDIPPR